MEFTHYLNYAQHHELTCEVPPIPPEVLTLPDQTGENDRSLELVGSDFLLGC